MGGIMYVAWDYTGIDKNCNEYKGITYTIGNPFAESSNTSNTSFASVIWRGDIPNLSTEQRRYINQELSSRTQSENYEVFTVDL